jgi:carbon monoxide dehydrogenase subunit G
MDISGSHRIPAPRDVVWAGLHDPRTLQTCLPGCERVERVSDGTYDGVAATKIGPLKARFSGRAVVTEVEAPRRAALAVSADGGPAGAATGSAEVTLAEDGDATVVTYAAHADVEGKIAQLGSRLVAGVARQTADAFFTRFAELAAEGRLGGLALAEAPPLAHEEPAETAAPLVDAPPLAAGVRVVEAPRPTPIAPTRTPDVPETLAPIEAETPPTGGSGGTATRALLIVGLLVVVAAALAYVLTLSPPA